MSDNDGFRAASEVLYPPADWGPLFWNSGTAGLELIDTIYWSRPLTEDALKSALRIWEQLRAWLGDLDWWVSDDNPSFEVTASSHLEATFRRLERIARYAFYAGARFTPDRTDLPPVGDWALDYELADSFVHRHIGRIDLATAATGLRKEVIRNMTRPMCRLPWARVSIGEWRFAMYADMLGAAPEYHWELDRDRLLRAVTEPQEPAKPPAPLELDPDTRSVRLYGREIASQLDPDVFVFVSAMCAAHSRPVPFKKIKQPGFGGKNQKRVRDRLKAGAPPLHELIKSKPGLGSYLELPTPPG